MFSHWQGIEICSKGIQASVGLSSRPTSPWTPWANCVLIIPFPVHLAALSGKGWRIREEHGRSIPEEHSGEKGLVFCQCCFDGPEAVLLVSATFPADSKSRHEWRATTSKQTKSSDNNRLVDRSLARPVRRLQSLEVHFPVSTVCWLGWLRLLGGREREVQLILSVEYRAWEQRRLRPESAPSSVGVRCWVPGNTPTTTSQWDYG